MLSLFGADASPVFDDRGKGSEKKLYDPEIHVVGIPVSLREDSFNRALLAAALVGAMWAWNTLVGYPDVRAAGLEDTRPVRDAVSAGAVPDVLPLLVLAFVTSQAVLEAVEPSIPSATSAPSLPLFLTVPALVVFALWVLPSRFLVLRPCREIEATASCVCIGRSGGKRLACSGGRPTTHMPSTAQPTTSPPPSPFQYHFIPMNSVLVGREAELKALIDAIEKGPGAILAGPAGIGKTRLALEAANETKRRVGWVAATADSSSIPYGAFHPLVPELGEPLASDSPASAFSLLRRGLSQELSLGLLTVDDAHHLDQSSASLIHTIARDGEIPIVVTVRDGEAVTGAITALWKDIGLTRMEIRPLGRADADHLAMLLLGATADGRTLARIWRLSRGHPLEMREMILAGQESGDLIQVDNVWTIGGSFQPTSRLVELVEDRLGRLEDDDRFAAEALAYGEPLDIQILGAVTETEVIERLERANVIRVLTTGASVTQATLAHPLYGEVLRATLPATRRAILASALAEASTQDGAHKPDPLRVATWRLESGEAGAEELEKAAISAVRRMAWDLALRFGTASLNISPSYMAHGCVAAALAELGDPVQAEAHLRAARELVEDPAMLAWNTISLADVWFYHAGRMEEALELVRKEVSRSVDPEIRDEVVSALAINLMMYGNIQEVVDISRDVLDSSESSSAARLMALVASTSADGLRLMPGDVHSGVEAAMPLVEQNRHRFANAEDILHIAHCVADLAAGKLTAARAIAQERLDLALESDIGDLPGIWTLYNGLILLYEGAARHSYETQLEALLLLDRYDSWLSKPLALVGAAHAAVVMAKPNDARRHIDALAPEMRKVPRIRSRVAHVEALLTASEGGLTAGAAAALAAGDSAAEDNHLLWGVEAWHLAVRLGSPDLVAERLAEVVAEQPGTVASFYHAHAQALMNEDVESLEAVLRDFDRAGFKLFAAETACQLSGIHRRRNEASRARRAAVLVGELLPEGSGASTPPFAELPDVVPLTRREREVALLAASGKTSRDIADRLFISIRSVDNHLSRVYTKFGVAGRSELSTVLAQRPD